MEGRKVMAMVMEEVVTVKLNLVDPVPEIQVIQEVPFLPVKRRNQWRSWCRSHLERQETIHRFVCHPFRQQGIWSQCDW
jgi:hypothetical protein